MLPGLDIPQLETLLSGEEPAGRLLTRTLGDRVQAIESRGGLAWLRLPDLGVSLMFEESVVPAEDLVREERIVLTPTAAHLYGPGSSGYNPYAHPLPGGISFGEARADIRSKLGEPGSVGGGRTDSVLYNRTPFWMKYPLGRVVMHLQLNDEDRLEMVTLLRV